MSNSRVVERFINYVKTPSESGHEREFCLLIAAVSYLALNGMQIGKYRLKPVGEAILASLNDPTLEMLDIEIVADWYGIAINKDNVELQQKIDAAITELEAEGFFTELNKKYFGGEEEAAAE